MPILKRTEKSIEQSFLRMLKKTFPNIRALKLNTIAQRSWPDRVIFLPEGDVVFIEFKRPGEKPTPLQYECHDYLRELGHDIQVFDDATEAFEYVKSSLNG